MIYDCFSFFNELDLLEIRLNVLKDVVDKFVLVEAGETHTGKPKPLYFKENASRFAAFRERIVYICIEKFPDICRTDWGRENYQRNAIAKGLIDAKDDDVVLVSDLDEIPRPEAIAKCVGKPGVTVFDQTYYAFYLNYRNVRQQWWHGTRMVSYKDFCHAFDGVEVMRDEFLPEWVNEGTTASKFRCRRLPRSRGGQRIVKNGGWHFTCLGGAEAVLAKMKAVVPHHDFDPDDSALTVERIESLLAKGQGPALKMNCFGVPLDDSFPRFLIDNHSKYAHLIFKTTPEYMRRVRWSRCFRTVQGRLIQFCEWAMPSWLHEMLHVIRMKLMSLTSRSAKA